MEYGEGEAVAEEAEEDGVGDGGGGEEEEVGGSRVRGRRGRDGGVDGEVEAAGCRHNDDKVPRGGKERFGGEEVAEGRDRT